MDQLTSWGRGGGLVDRAADSGLYDPSSIPLGEKKENKRGWLIQKKIIKKNLIKYFKKSNGSKILWYQIMPRGSNDRKRCSDTNRKRKKISAIKFPISI